MISIHYYIYIILLSVHVCALWYLYMSLELYIILLQPLWNSLAVGMSLWQYLDVIQFSLQLDHPQLSTLVWLPRHDLLPITQIKLVFFQNISKLFLSLSFFLSVSLFLSLSLYLSLFDIQCEYIIACYDPWPWFLITMTHFWTCIHNLQVNYLQGRLYRLFRTLGFIDC